MTTRRSFEVEDLQKRNARWKSAVERWDGLGYHAKVYYLSVKMIDDAKAKGETLGGSKAYWDARVKIDFGWRPS